VNKFLIKRGVPFTFSKHRERQYLIGSNSKKLFELTGVNKMKFPFILLTNLILRKLKID
jgi:hypothetical protein